MRNAEIIVKIKLKDNSDCGNVLNIMSEIRKAIKKNIAVSGIELEKIRGLITLGEKPKLKNGLDEIAKVEESETKTKKEFIS